MKAEARLIHFDIPSSYSNLKFSTFLSEWLFFKLSEAEVNQSNLVQLDKKNLSTWDRVSALEIFSGEKACTHSVEGIESI